MKENKELKSIAVSKNQSLSPANEVRYTTFNDFWPFYLTQHQKKGTQQMHALGTTGLLVWLLAMLATRRWWYLLYGLATVYGLAWISHFFIERNKPATFTYPFYSMLGDFRMYGFFVRGKLEIEIRKQGVLLEEGKQRRLLR